MPVNFDVVRTRVYEVKSAINELLRLTSKSYNELSLDEKYSIRYNIIMLVEALVALCLHIAREVYSYTPKSYTDAVRLVCEKLKIPCVNDLVALVRLRNIIIHRYWSIDDHKIYESVKRDFKCINELINTVEKTIGCG